MYGAPPTTVLRPRASLLTLGVLALLTTISCVELVAHASPVKSLDDTRTWAKSAVIPLTVTVIMSSCATLPPLAVRIAVHG